jgi:hypothetical protein
MPVTRPAGTTTDKLYANLNERFITTQNDIREIKTILQQLLVENSKNAEHVRLNDMKTDNLHAVVMGNGKPGLKTDMQLMKEQMNRVYAIGGVITSAIIFDIVSRILLR